VLDEKKDHIYEELKSQLAIFEKAGIEIDHFSDHHGMVSHTKIGRKALYKVVLEYNKANNKRISIRNPLFISSLIKRRENFLHTSNCFKASAHPLAILNLIRDAVHIVSGRHRGMNTYQFKRKGQMNFLKEMNKVGIPSTDYFVDSFWGSKTEKTVREVFNKNNYNVGSKVTRPLDPEEPTVEIMLHIAKSKNRFSGNYKKEIERLEKTKGVDPGYVKGGRVEEFKLLEKFLDRHLKKKDRVSFKQYIRPLA
ncbi:MAG: ChbG/HpnK family deacetylase, partial [Rhodothermales bacterium]